MMMRVMYPQGLALNQDPRELLLEQVNWLSLEAASVEGGIGNRVWKSGGFMILSEDWTDSGAKLYANTWGREIQEIEVPDVFLEQYGIR